MTWKRSFSISISTLILALFLFSNGFTEVYGAGNNEKKKAGKSSISEKKYERLKEKGRKALTDENYEKAAKLFTMAMQGVPAQADNPYYLANACARMGKTDAFWQALEEAVKLGYDGSYKADEAPAFKKYGSDPRFRKLVEGMKANEKEHCNAAQKATELPSIDSVPSFKNLEDLDKFFENESREAAKDNWVINQWDFPIRENTRMARKVASLQRYEKEHPDASDIQDARGELIRTWRNMAAWVSAWTIDVSKSLRQSIDDFLIAYPDSPQKGEFEFYRIESVLRGVLNPEDICIDWENYPSLDYASTVPLLDAFIAGGNGSPWITRALALKSLCLYKIGPSKLDLAKEAYGVYLKRSPIPDTEKIAFDYDMDFELRPFRFLINGAPEIKGKTVEGRTLSLSGLRGKVVLLDFWSPG